MIDGSFAVLNVIETRRVRFRLSPAILSFKRGAMPCSHLFRAGPVITHKLRAGTCTGTRWLRSAATKSSMMSDPRLTQAILSPKAG